MAGVQNTSVVSQLLSDQNQNINKSSPVGYTSGAVSKQNSSEGKHQHDQQRLTHEQVLMNFSKIHLTLCLTIFQNSIFLFIVLVSSCITNGSKPWRSKAKFGRIHENR